MAVPSPVMVIGIGNLLMGDEGVGVHAIDRLRQRPWPDHVSLLDGGTGGFHLLEYLQGQPRVVMIDATTDGQAPGTVSELRPRYAADFPRSLTAHDIGLRDLMDAVVLVGGWPDVTLITVSIAEVAPMVITLSPAVEAALPEVEARVRACVGCEEGAHA